jgi:hypothetical protein
MKSENQQLGSGNAGLFIFVMTAVWLILFYYGYFR